MKYKLFALIGTACILPVTIPCDAKPTAGGGGPAIVRPITPTTTSGTTGTTAASGTTAAGTTGVKAPTGPNQTAPAAGPNQPSVPPAEGTPPNGTTTTSTTTPAATGTTTTTPAGTTTTTGATTTTPTIGTASPAPTTITTPTGAATTPGATTSTTSTSPSIVGTVAGTGGKTYYIGADGIIYFRGSDNQLHPFGLAVPKTLQSEASPARAGASNAVTSTSAGGFTNALPSVIPPVPGAVSSTAGLSNNAVNRFPTASTGISNSASLSPTGATNLSGMRFSQPNIGQKVIGNNGQTFFIGTDGFLYYRAQDGMLHVVGSGAPTQ